MKPQGRLSRAAQRLTNRVPRIVVRGQLGPAQDTELARLTGARR